MDLSGFLSALVADWISLMSGVASVVLTVLGFFRKPQTHRKMFWSAALLSFFIASVRIWTAEHRRNQEQITYIELDTSQTTNPVAPLLLAGNKAAFNFGRNNSGSYRADDVYGIAALEIRNAAGPPKGDGQMWLTSPSLEKETWSYFLQTHPGPYSKSVMTPGRVGLTFTSALSDHVLTPKEIEDVNSGTKVMYVLAFVVWTDAAGTHERHRCQFFHFPPSPPFVLEDCYGYNDFLAKAVN
jgi:hypothetical protein